MRIASLLAGGTEIVHALGLGESLVAISHECDFPTEALSKPRVTFTKVHHQRSSADIDRQVKAMSVGAEALYGIDEDLLVSLAPDVIITQVQCEVCAVSEAMIADIIRGNPTLRGARLVALNPVTFEDLFNDIQRVGEATGRLQEAAKVVQALKDRTEHVRRLTELLPEQSRPRVACVEWIEPLMLSANWMPDLVRLAGGRHDLTRSGDRTQYFEWSELLSYDPDVILVMPCGFDLERSMREAEVLRSKKEWNGLRAVRDDRVFVVDGNAYFNRSGPRLVDSLEILAEVLHPSLFSRPVKGRDLVVRKFN